MYVSGKLVWAEHTWHWRSGTVGAAEGYVTGGIATFEQNMARAWSVGVGMSGDVTSAMSDGDEPAPHAKVPRLARQLHLVNDTLGRTHTGNG